MWLLIVLCLRSGLCMATSAFVSSIFGSAKPKLIVVVKALFHDGDQVACIV